MGNSEWVWAPLRLLVNIILIDDLRRLSLPFLATSLAVGEADCFSCATFGKAAVNKGVAVG